MLSYADGPGAERTSDETDAVDGEWRRTGDLVEIVDGRALFRGRTSEVINVGGVKVHPLPVEVRINALADVAAARVFGRANRLTGAVVAVEVVPASGAVDADLDSIREQIRDAVSDLPRAWQPRSVAFVESIQTLGDKTVRRVEA
jgi:acyl-coenzyme A synthetase/AMP-(fatty) acid ligase